MTVSDPFTRASQAIASALLAWPGFASLVRGNLVDMTSGRFERFKAEVQSGDLPEVAIVQGDFVMHPFGGDSRSVELAQSYRLMMTFESLNVVAVNALKYQTCIALLKAGPALGLDGLVRRWQVTSGQDNPSGPSAWTRGTERWFSALTIEVEMYLDRASTAVL